MDSLIARLEEATEGDREMDALVWLALGEEIPPATQAKWDAPIPLHEYARISVDATTSRQFTRNLAAAARAVPKDRKGGWYWRVGHATEWPGWAHLYRYHPNHCDAEDEITVHAATPELALTIAALKARESHR
jgi:hypothetical protein